MEEEGRGEEGDGGGEGTGGVRGGLCVVTITNDYVFTLIANLEGIPLKILMVLAQLSIKLINIQKQISQRRGRKDGWREREKAREREREREEGIKE